MCAPFITGLASGFASGGAAVSELYGQGGCTRAEAERALALCTNAGPAFVIAGVGAMLGGVRYGVILYAVQLASLLLCSLILPGRGTGKAPPLPIKREKGGLLVRAVCGAVLPMLNICAFVVVFSPIVALLRALLCRLGAPPCITAALLSLVEITNACAYISSYLPTRLALPFCSLAVCWSGLCTHAQILYTVSMEGLSIKYCIAGKLFSGACAFVISWLICGCVT